MMTWTVTKESGAVSISDWPAEDAPGAAPEQLALMQAFRTHPPLSLKLTLPGDCDPFETRQPETDAPGAAGLALFLGQSHTIYEDLLNLLPVMIQVVDGRGNLLSANQASAEMLGYAPDELIGRHVLSLLTERSRRRVREDVLPGYFETGQCANVDVELLTKTGATVAMRMSAVGHKDAAGRIACSIAVFGDLSAPSPEGR